MENLGQEVLLWALSLLGTIITSIVLPSVVVWLKTKIKNEKLKHVYEELSSTVVSSVNYVNQTFVDQMKKDGKFDTKNQKIALTKATTYALDTLSNTTKKIIEDEGVDIQQLIIKHIEDAINTSKKW